MQKRYIFLLGFLFMAVAQAYAFPPADSVVLSIDTVAVEVVDPAAHVCLPVRAQTFDSILGMQYSVVWDAAELTFDSLYIPGSVESLDALDFGFNGTAQTISWIHSPLTGVTLTPGTVLYELCFLPNITSGFAAVSFSQSPTPTEFISIDDELLPYTYINGGVDLGAETNDVVVWPGDTDANGLVDQNDLLPIGLAYGASGPARSATTIAWAAQPTTLWGTAVGEPPVDLSHIDADGNGVIAAEDSLALVANWENETEFAPVTPPDSRELGPILTVVADTFFSGQPAALSITLGDGQNPAEEIYGIAFDLLIDQSLIEPGSMYLTFENSLLDAAGGTPLHFYRARTAANTWGVASVRTDGSVTSGFGEVARLHFIPDLPTGTTTAPLEVAFANIKLIDGTGSSLDVEAGTAPVLIQGTTGTEEPLALRQIRLFPTLTADWLTLRTSDLEVHAIELIDVEGRVLQAWPATDQVDVRQLAAGTYWLRISTDAGTAVRQFARR